MPNTLLLTSPRFSVKFFIFKFIIVLLPTNWLHPLMITKYYNFGDVACTSSSERCNQLKYGCSNASEAEGRRSGSRCRSFSNKSTARGFAPVKYSLKFFFEKVGRLLIYVRACSYTEPSKIVMHTYNNLHHQNLFYSSFLHQVFHKFAEWYWGGLDLNNKNKLR